MEDEATLEVRASGKSDAGKGLFTKKDVPEGEYVCSVFGRWVVEGIQKEVNHRFRLTFPGQKRAKHAASLGLLYEPYSCQAIRINDFGEENNCKFVLEAHEDNENDFTLNVVSTQAISKVCSMACSLCVQWHARLLRKIVDFISVFFC